MTGKKVLSLSFLYRYNQNKNLTAYKGQEHTDTHLAGGARAYSAQIFQTNIYI